MVELDKMIEVDWKWVEAHLTAKERLGKIVQGSTKDAILGHLKEAFDIARSKTSPKVSFIKKDIMGFKPDSLQLEGGTIFCTKELSSYLKGAKSVYAFLVTIGKDVEDAASSYMSSGDHLLGYLLDRIGSFAVESLAERTESALRSAFAPEGLSVSMRFSPGYCDWRIEEQFKLAKIIDFAKAGVALTESCMMVPKKSISAVVGVGNKGLFSKLISPCAVCNMKVCDYRRAD